MEQQEFLGQLQLTLDSLQMQDVYDAVEAHGEIVKVSFTKWTTKVWYKDGYGRCFSRWDFY